MNYSFPFTAIVGMELVKRSLVYHAIDPTLGGLLLMGQRGCAKSTLARSFREVLPSVSEGQEAPFVEVPLGTTEDRLLGSFDASRLLADGEWSAQKGLIQQANNGVLYIDEVNLLPDHLVDSILDSAASGQHRIERDGLSINVSAHYILIGSMNPEEGDLRPQLLDRFALAVDIRGLDDSRDRVAIMERILEFESDPIAFREKWQSEVTSISTEIMRAREIVDTVSYSRTALETIAALTSSLRVDGHRADLVILRASRAHAALCGQLAISHSDILLAAQLALPHRIKKGPFESEGLALEELETRLEQVSSDVQESHSLESELEKSDTVKKKT